MNVYNFLDKKIIPNIDLEKKSAPFRRVYLRALKEQIRKELNICVCKDKRAMFRLMIWGDLGNEPVHNEDSCKADFGWCKEIGSIILDIHSLAEKVKKKGYYTYPERNRFGRPRVSVCFSCRTTQKVGHINRCQICREFMQPIPYTAKVPPKRSDRKWKLFEEKFSNDKQRKS